jgi:hypothetical protein
VGTGNQLVCSGDSLTVGTGGTSSYCTQLVLTDSFTIINTAVGGKTMATMKTEAATVDAPYFTPGSQRNVNVLWGGTNDLYNYPASTPVTVFRDLIATVQFRKSVGYQVFVPTMISRCGFAQDGTTTMASLKNGYNALIRGGALRYGYTVVDFGVDPHLDPDAACTDTNYYTGGLHLLDAGYALIAGYVSTSVNGVQVDGRDGSGTIGNLMLKSEAISAPWVDGGSIAYSANQTDPLGGANATTLTPSTSNGIVYQPITGLTASTVYTFSVWIRGTGQTALSVWTPSTAYTTLLASEIIPVDAVWRRYSVTFNTGAATSVRFAFGTNNAWATGSPITVFGAQLSAGSLGPYIRTSNTTIPMQVGTASFGNVLRPSGTDTCQFRNITSADSGGNALSNDCTFSCDATGAQVNIFLPTAASSFGRIIHMKKVDAGVNDCRLYRSGSATGDTVDGAVYQGTGIIQWSGLTVQSDGVGKWIVVK